MDDLEMSDDRLPGTVTMNIADLQRLASLAAGDAVRMMKDQNGDTQDLIDSALDQFCIRLGLPTDKAEIEEWRRDMAFNRSSREFKTLVVEHGIKAGVTVAVGGLITGIYLLLKGKTG